MIRTPFFSFEFMFFHFVILVELYNMILLISTVLTGIGIQNWNLSILNPELLLSGSEKNNLIYPNIENAERKIFDRTEFPSRVLLDLQ